MSSLVAANKDIDKVLGMRLRALRKYKKMKLQPFADILGITLQQLSKYELGINRIAASTVVMVCRACEVTPDFFFDPLFDGETAQDMRKRIEQYDNFANRLRQTLDIMK